VQDRREQPQLGYRRGRPGGRSTGLLTRILTLAGGAVLLVGAIAISIVVFVVVLAAIVVFGLYLWWKTRHIRRQLRARRHDDNVIEGEVIRKDESPPRPPDHPGA
jgi:Flp pilus assembly protein TadB